MDDNLRDQPRPLATNDDSKYTLTIDTVAHHYAEAGHPRTIRTLQRYCASGHLDCLKQPTTLGDMYRITPASVARHLAQLDEITAATEAATGRAMSRPDATLDARENAAHPNVRPPAADNDEPRQATTDAEGSSRYVARLEGEVEFLREQIATKDEQIKDLTERSRETNHLIGGLQRMLTPLLGTRDPFPSSDRHGDGGLADPSA